MLPDFRFALGAILAITVLGVAGLGLVTSVQLVHEARMGPLEASRSLAFAGHTEWNQFYDPDSARRFEGLAGKTEGPLAEARLEAPLETSPLIAPAGPDQRTASIPAHQPDAGIADDETPRIAETTATVTIAPAPSGAVGAPASDAPETAGSGAPPADRVASAPESDLRKAAPPEPQAAGNPPQDQPTPTPRARPKAGFGVRLAHARIRHVRPAGRQTLQNSGFPMTNAQWPGYGSQFSGTTIAKKSTGKFTSSFPDR